MAALLHFQFLTSALCPSLLPRRFPRNPNVLILPSSPKLRKLLRSKPVVTPLLAFTESSEGSTQSTGPSLQSLLRQLSDSFDLPSDYFSQLPNDLRLDLNDAAFDLSNGPVIDECGQELGNLLLNLSRAWEQSDMSATRDLASKLPVMESTLTGKAKSGKKKKKTLLDVSSALGRRLLSSGKRFQSMGQYGQGELQKIAQAMITTGKFLIASSTEETIDKEPMTETKVFKFGALQVAITPAKANIGAALGAVFGILSWELAQGVQSIPESSLQYANDNALLLATSLRGVLLALCYSSTVLSALTCVGLVILGRQLKSEDK
ncbi:hypothetical protein LINPERHAP1_LOCUS720 [Linum perenne]